MFWFFPKRVIYPALVTVLLAVVFSFGLMGAIAASTRTINFDSMTISDPCDGAFAAPFSIVDSPNDDVIASDNGRIMCRVGNSGTFTVQVASPCIGDSIAFYVQSDGMTAYTNLNSVLVDQIAYSGDGVYNLTGPFDEFVADMSAGQSTYLDDLVIDYTCPPGEETAPGCDLMMPVPADAANGLFIADAPLLWGPGDGKSTGLTVEAGKTYLVTGQDATGHYRQIMLGCNLLWVPAGAVVPNPESPWNGTALPGSVVE